MDKVLAFQITTVEEILRVKPTLSRVSYQSPISCTVQDLFITARQSSFQNSFHTLLFVFWWTKSSHTRSQLWKRLLGWSWRHHGSAISHPSLLHSSRSVHHSKTVQFPKQFSRSSLSLFFFFFFFSVITTVKETLRVKQTPSQVSYWSPIPCAQFKICSAQQDSLLSKTVSTLFSIPFGEPGLSIPDHNWRHCGWLLVTHLSYTAWDP